MSNLLDEGALDDLASRLSDAAEAEPEAEVEAQPEAVEEVEEESPLEEDVSEEVEAASEEGSSPVDAEASEDGDEDDKGDDADGHAVPYKRFQKVIQARNSFREEGESLRQQIEELKAQVNQIGRAPRELLIQAVVQNPNENLNTVAERYSSYIAEVQEKAIAEHMKTVEVAPKKKVGPPRPKKTGAAKTEEAPKPLDRDSRYKAVQEAIARMT